ncbi:MAG TPA: tetratricopeptide repeat protein [Solirubrobacteraceae bacterium]|jgi:tetratricopeptide (TPR) repeat protein|nr:tetratricopeptide repeat protein [Solirubrobacteraceae bacterium]
MSEEATIDLLSVLRDAELLERQGAHEGAEAGFRRAAVSADPAIKAAALRGVASYLVLRGSNEEGLDTLRRVVEIGDPQETARALRNIGTLLEDDFHDRAGARSAYEQAIACEHPLHSQGARVNLAQLVEREGDLDRARRLFVEAIDSGHPVESNRARVLLGFSLEATGDDTGALRCFEEAMREPDSEWGQRGGFQAGAIYLAKLGNPGRACDAFSVASRLPEPNFAVTAMFLLGEAERERDNEDGAIEAYASAVSLDGISTPDGRSVVCDAAKQAGSLYLQRRDPESARPYLTLAATADDGEERARGACLLGLCEREAGNSAAARDAFRHSLSNPAAPPEIVELARRSLLELG